MEWIEVKNDSEVPLDKNIIVEDINGWVGQAYWDGQNFVLETFGQTMRYIAFGKIERYLIFN